MRRGLVWSLVFIIVLSVGAFVGTLAAGHRILLGLDLKGGVSVVLQPQGTVDHATLQEAVNIIDKRVNGLGVAGSNVERQGNDVVISLPDVKDPQQALSELGQTAAAYFRPVICEIPPYAAPASTTPTTTPHHAVTPTTAPASNALGPTTPTARLTAFQFPEAKSKAKAAATTTVPATTIVPNSQSTTGTPVPVNIQPNASNVDQICAASNSAEVRTTSVSIPNYATSYVILPYYDNSVRYVLGPMDMSGAEVSNAAVEVDTQTGQYTVQVTFTSKGSSDFDKIASERYPEYQSDPSNPPYSSLEAFELDGIVQSAPTIQAASFNGTAVISGSTSNPFTSSQASALALALRYGSLPVRFVPQQVQTVSATIGQDSLRAGLLAGIGGLIVVMIYMMVYYRILGLIVFSGLALATMMLYAIFATLSATSNLALTLAGVVGFIVSIGITVDSYVVFFERLKDEVRAGRSVRSSVERSFKRAFRTVLTADLVSFMAAIILYLLSIGDVRGFAFTLGLATLLDVFFAWFFIRPAVILIGRRRSLVEAPLFGINRGLAGRPVAGET